MIGDQYTTDYRFEGFRNDAAGFYDAVLTIGDVRHTISYRVITAAEKVKVTRITGTSIQWCYYANVDDLPSTVNLYTKNGYGYSSGEVTVDFNTIEIDLTKRGTVNYVVTYEGCTYKGQITVG